MNLKQFNEILDRISASKHFLSVNFGCRVNSAETNQLSQILVDHGFSHNSLKPSIILINTCAITKKGEKESHNKIKSLHRQFPSAIILVTGCADFKKITDLENVFTFDNSAKEKILDNQKYYYSPRIKDKFSHTHRFILKIQSGCNQFCSYCIVPTKRSETWSLPINDAVDTIKQAIRDGYQEVIITGINLNLYKYGFSNLVETFLNQTTIPLISFGSIPLLSVDQKFINLYKKYNSRISHFLHIPLQSCSDKILKLMHRPYNQKNIIKITEELKSEIRDLKLGTDIIVGFPTETDSDFQETLDTCQKIGFTKIHCFKFSPRPNTVAKTLHQSNLKISKETLSHRSQQIRNLISKN